MSWFWDGTTCPNCKSPHTDHHWDQHRGETTYSCADCMHTWKKESHGPWCKCPKCKPQKKEQCQDNRVVWRE